MMKRCRVGEVMSQPAISVKAQTGYRRLVELMHDNQVSALPVVDEEARPLGVASEEDLLARERVQASPADAAWAERWRLGADRITSRARRAGELMSTPATTITADAPLAVAARRMHDQGVRRLVVVDDEGRTIGIVSRSDLLRPYLATADEIRSAVWEAIRSRAAWSDVSSVDVDVDEGTVRLTGEVEYRSDALALVALARSLDSVIDVDDQLLCRIEDVAAGLHVDDTEV
jgi:CBS domain-containing protein